MIDVRLSNHEVGLIEWALNDLKREHSHWSDKDYPDIAELQRRFLEMLESNG